MLCWLRFQRHAVSNRLPKISGRAVFEALPRGKNTVVVLESTFHPGVTSGILVPCWRLGLEQGVDVTIAYCPERFKPATWDERSDRRVSSVAATRRWGLEPLICRAKLTSEDVRYVGRLRLDFANT